MAAHSFIVGAYASLPKGWEQQHEYYRALEEQEWIQGTELPYPGNLANAGELTWLSVNLPLSWNKNTATLIPGTMQNVWKNPLFGLASPDVEGRKAAIDFTHSAWESIMKLAQMRNSNDIAFLEIHTAPTKLASKDAMRQSIEEVLSWDWHGTQLVIEHCDCYVEHQNPEKGFLSIEDEVLLCRQTGIGLTINWGRSCVEGRSAQTPLQHIQYALDNRVLKGLMFSGASPKSTQYGYEWIDGHLPMDSDEPSSLMTHENIQQCAALALSAPTLAYMGAKVCVPEKLDFDGRISYLEHVYRATNFGDYAAKE